MTLCAVALGCAVTAVARATLIVPTSDAQVIEVLPPAPGGRREDRRLRQLVAARPADVRLALRLARQDLDQARSSGDPRFAGLALALLGRWTAPATAPAQVLLLRATIQQFLHDFDAARATLAPLLARADANQAPQAWLTLATIERVQGHYAASDQACAALIGSAADRYGVACLAENAGLRGDVARARKDLRALLADSRVPVAAHGWLLTTLAELEERSGRADAADTAFRQALSSGADAYTEVAYADFLIDRHRAAAALAVLKDATRTDAVLLRLASAGALAHAASARADAAEMRDRIALANQRPDAQIFHGREQALFALYVEHAPEQAWRLARGDVSQQREAIDLLVLARAAAATGRPEALAEARQLKNSVGLFDRRIDALL
jgi:hypothetical protein